VGAFSEGRCRNQSGPFKLGPFNWATGPVGEWIVVPDNAVVTEPSISFG
jgi:hypothetical protein